MQDCSDTSCQLNVIKLENVNLQAQVQSMKMMLEDRFENEQKDQLRKTIMTDLNKLKTQKDVTRFIARMKQQMEQVMNDYLALKEFNQQKSNEIVQFQEQIDKQDKVLSVLRQHEVRDVSQLIQSHDHLKQQNQQMQQQINQQIVMIDGLNQKNNEVQQSNQQLTQYIQHCQNQLDAELKTSKEERKREMREIMNIDTLEDQQQKEQGLKDYLQKNSVIVQQVEQDIEEEKKKEQARLLAIKKAEAAKAKRGRYGNINRMNNKYQSVKAKPQKRPASQKVNKQSEINNNDRSQFNTFQEQAKQLNKKNSLTNQGLIKSTIYNKKGANSRSSSKVMNSSQKQISRNNFIKDINIDKKEEQNGQTTNNDFLTTNVLNSNYISQPIKIDNINGQMINNSNGQTMNKSSSNGQLVNKNGGQNLSVIKRHIETIVSQITKSKIAELQQLASPPVLVKTVISNVSQYLSIYLLKHQLNWIVNSTDLPR